MWFNSCGVPCSQVNAFGHQPFYETKHNAALVHKLRGILRREEGELRFRLLPVLIQFFLSHLMDLPSLVAAHGIRIEKIVPYQLL